MYDHKYHKSDIVVREITKGIYKVEKSKLNLHKQDTYLDSTVLTLLLNTENVLILNKDDYVIHSNFRANN